MEPDRRGMPTEGVRGTDGILLMLDRELFAVLAPLFVVVLVATQLLVPELTVDPRAMFERVAGDVTDEGVRLGAVTRGVEGLFVLSVAVEGEEVEMEGIRVMPVPDERPGPLEGTILIEGALLELYLLPLEDPREEDPKMEPKEGREDEDPREEDPREEDPKMEPKEGREDEEPRDELEEEEPLAGLIEEPREPRWAWARSPRVNRVTKRTRVIWRSRRIAVPFWTFCYRATVRVGEFW